MDRDRQHHASQQITVERLTGFERSAEPEILAVEEPLEIQLGYTAEGLREAKSVSITMRTPGNDAELAVGFLISEGIVGDADEIAAVVAAEPGDRGGYWEQSRHDGIFFSARSARNVVRIELMPHVEVSAITLQRNFYTTSSCGVCGKASLLALQTLCPPRITNTFSIEAETLYGLPATMRAQQGLFRQTGGLHAAALFDATGRLDSMREDVGRHNAVDKLVGAAALADQLPLRNRGLLLSGRASFELVQKALMAGIPMVAAVGAPSSLAVRVAAEFGITLIGFLREDHFNIYHGGEHVQIGSNKQSAPRYGT